jgi:ABC-type uncharacterized transport system substrate-binding protein
MIHRVLTISSVVLIFLVATMHRAVAHPHAWIDIQTIVLFDSKGRITGLHERWLFDEFYTEFAIKDFALTAGGKIRPEKLLELAEGNLNNLKEYSYFTYLDADGMRQTFKSHENVTSTLEGKRIAMSFTLHLTKPIDPRTTTVSYRIYDPSYYVEMKHLAKDGVVISGNLGTCTTRLDIPKPDAAFVTLAAALDKNAKGPDDMGSFFAERVHIACHKGE